VTKTTLREITKEALQEILKKHLAWVNDEPEGKKADLSSANLRSADLRSANLRSADLRSADLRSADLRSADLSYADLSYANLSYANLSYADLFSPQNEPAKIKSAMGWIGLYNYWVFVAFTDKGTFVRMGCHWRSLADWEADFWNNNSEFPNNGSSKSNMRLAAFTFTKEWIKNNS